VCVGVCCHTIIVQSKKEQNRGNWNHLTSAGYEAVIFYQSGKNIIFWKLYLQERNNELAGKQTFSQAGVQVSCGQPFSLANYFIFHMLPYNLFTG